MPFDVASKLVLMLTHLVAAAIVVALGAIALAGLLASSDRSGRNVVIQTGGNLDAAMLVEVMAGRTPPP